MKPRKNWPLDAHGIPVISADDIESKAEEVLRFFDEPVLSSPRVTPLSTIIEALRTRYAVAFDFQTDLGEAAIGRKVLGKYSISKRSISIDPSLPQGEDRWRFTVAHEIGHFAFHRKLSLKRAAIRADTQKSLEVFEEDRRSPLEWVEWQANAFASALLVPRATLPVALCAFQQERGIIKNVGSIYLDATHFSRHEFSATLSHLSMIYQVSRTVMDIRLRKRGLVIDRSLQDVQSIHDLFRTEEDT